MTTEAIYKSPKHKLLKFFENSRNRWKEKCLKAKEQIRYYRNRTRFLEESKEQYKNRVKELELETARLKCELELKENELQESKKKEKNLGK